MDSATSLKSPEEHEQVGPRTGQARVLGRYVYTHTSSHIHTSVYGCVYPSNYLFISLCVCVLVVVSFVYASVDLHLCLVHAQLFICLQMKKRIASFSAARAEELKVAPPPLSSMVRAGASLAGGLKVHMPSFPGHGKRTQV